MLFDSMYYVMDDKVAELDGEKGSMPGRSMKYTDYTQDLLTVSLHCRSVCDERSLKALFLKGSTHSICNTLHHGLAERQYNVLEYMAHRAESLQDLHERPL